MDSPKLLPSLYLDAIASSEMQAADHPEYQIINAFSTHTDGGNPAAIVFLTEVPSDVVLEKIRDIVNQPIVVYVFPPKANTLHRQGVAAFGLRYYGPWSEVKICGHGTLSAAEAIFRKLKLSEETKTLEFQTLSGILTAQRVSNKISMDLPAGITIPASTEEEKLVKAAFCLALGKPEVAIRYAGYGGPGYENYLFVEVDISEELSTWKPDVQHFTKFAPRTHILVVTSASRQPGISYETRMFAPAIRVPEDHVCGSAHCLNAPYWAAKHGYPSGEEQYAKAVSRRGGDIWSTYFECAGKPGRVRLRGDVKLTASGTLDITDY